MVSNQSSPGSDPQGSDVFKVGDRVRHGTFGEGLVLEVTPHNDDVLLRVSFSADGSQRRLMSRPAQLERIKAV
jgi:hypothetical protein